MPLDTYCNRPQKLGAVFFMLLFCLAGCKEDPTIWSASSRSPTGNLVAIAHTVQHGGFGTDGVETLVELKQTSGLKTSTRVLAFANDGAGLSLRMNWLSPNHLEVSFKDDPSVLYFQVVKTSGIDISVRDLAGQADSSSH